MNELQTLENIIEGLQQQLEASQQACETERMRLAACGVIALSNTRESAKKQRKMHPDYHSASLDDVIRAVDAEMDLREQLASANEEIESTNKTMNEILDAAIVSEHKITQAKADGIREFAASLTFRGHLINTFEYDDVIEFAEQLEGKG